MLKTRNSRLSMRRMIAETGVVPAGLSIIRDTFPFEVIEKTNTVVEDRNGGELNVLRVKGLIQHGDTQNANRRFYSTREVLTPAVEEIQNDISNRAVLGEFDHPVDAKIHLDRVSHVMTKIWMEGKKVFGEAEVLHKLPMGAALRGLFEHKVRVGISSRGVGDMELVEHNGDEVYSVMPGYAFVTWDAVAEPSVDGAILRINESLERKIKPIRSKRKLFSEEAYQDILVKEINAFFGISDRKKIVPVSTPKAFRKT